MGGRQAGTLYEGDRRFDMVVRLPETVRTDVAGMSSLLIPVLNAAQGANQIGFIPLSQVANLDLQLGPNQNHRRERQTSGYRQRQRSRPRSGVLR